MALSTATITYDIADLTGVDFDARRTRVWVTTNIPDGTIADTVGNQVRLGDGRGSLADDGTGSVTVWVPGTGSNPASWQTTLHVDYQPRGGGGRVVRNFGPFTITANADLADLVAEQSVPAAAVGGDAAVAAFIGSSSSATTAALAATYPSRSNTNITGAGHQIEWFSGGSDSVMHVSALTGFSGPYLFGLGVDRAGSYAGQVISIKRQATGLSIDQWGDGGVGVQRSAHAPTAIENTDIYVGSFGVQYALKTSQSFADGASGAGSTTFTSATAAFAAGDVGKTITSDQPNTGTIPAGTTITAVNSATSVTLSAAATESLSGVVFTVGSRAPAATQKMLTMLDTDGTSVLFRFRKGDWSAAVPLVGKDAASSVLRVQAQSGQSADLQSWRDLNTNIYTRINKDGYFATRKVAAPADADVTTGEAFVWFDQTAGAAKLMVKAKNASGTVVTGSVALA